MSIFTPLNITSQGDPDGIDLEACYFVEEDSGDFLFLAPGNSPIAVKFDTPFDFTFQELNWTVTFVHYSNLTRRGHGTWSALPAKSAGDGKDPEDPETGTFQAQAGTGTGNDDKLSARASASA